MNKTWAAEIAVDEALATALIQDQFPRLSPVIVEPLGAGWDNTVFRVNGRFVFRFPRRAIAVDLIQTELRCLPLLAPRLPVPIPIPVYAGRPSPSYPWPFVGYSYLSGHRAPRDPTDMAWRRRLAPAIAGFLRVLHAVSPADLQAEAIPFDTLARLDGRSRREATEGRLAFLQAAGVIIQTERILSILDQAPEPPAATALVVAHGDLHVGQLLVTEQGGLAGVIDWGDLHVEHPAVDLAIAHQLLPVAWQDAFLSNYGAVDSTTWLLAKTRAAWHAVALLASATDSGDELLAAEAKTALRFITDQ
jgi:aminoglycoside phosphotransferase (APT) family kinase protein